MRPYFSVITPSFNQGTYIGRCLRSVAGQGDTDYEHLVIDNCSNDATDAEVGGFPGVRFISEPDRGQSDAVNKGFQAAGGEIICWLNSDDAYPPGVFGKLRALFADPGVEVIFGDVGQVAYDGLPDLRVEARFEDRLDMVRWWSRRVRLHQPAVFFRRRVMERTGLLREDLHYAMDYEYWWRMSEHARFRRVPEILAIQHRQPESKTVRAWRRVYDERETIFSPHYHLVDGGDRRALLAEKRRAMADRYLGEAFAAASSDPRAATSLLLASFGEDPLSVLRPRWLGIPRRMVGEGRGHAASRDPR
jgi:glycosyltransferase involved in cell wall biosynthesis